MNYWRKVIAIVQKDILSEIRTKESISTVLVFALLVIIIFSFAFGTNKEMITQLAPGMLWVTFTFSGVLSLSRLFVSEKENGCLDGLLAAPVSREIIYIGKMLSNLIFMLIIEIIALPVFAILFNLPTLSIQLAVVSFLATIGFAAVGTLFSAVAVNTKAREMVLPLLFLPIVVPVIICAVKATESALSSNAWSDLLPWIQIIIAFDAIFLVIPLLIFSYVIEE